MSSVRPYDLDLLRKSFDVAKKAREGGDHPFGSVLGDETGALLMEQGNGYSAEGGDRTAHAERLLASRAAKAYPLEKLAKMTLYTSAEPCAMCAGAISFARIRRLYFGASDSKGGAVDHGPRFFSQPTCHHTPEIYGGMNETDAADLLREFFKLRREANS